MTDRPGWRRAYDASERVLAPRAEALVRGREFAVGTSALVHARRAIGRGVSGATALAWHAVNLPAWTDVLRLRSQIGALDRDVRRLSLHLEQSATGRGRGGEQR